MDKSANLNFPLLRIELFKVNMTRLWKFWKNGEFSRTFWCPYWNDAPGAGILQDGAKLPLTEDRIYLLPPNPSYGTYCTSQTVTQFFCQFYLPGFYSDKKLIPVPLTPFLKPLLQHAVDAWNRMDNAYYFPALSLISAAIYESRDSNGILPLNSLEMEPVRRKMLECLGTPLPITNYARIFNMTEKALNTRFKAAYGCTPYHYLSMMRFERASLMLRSSQDTIEEIGLNVGFADRNYFTRWFTKLAGMPPATYRKLNREE